MTRNVCSHGLHPLRRVGRSGGTEAAAGFALPLLVLVLLAGCTEPDRPAGPVVFYDLAFPRYYLTAAQAVPAACPGAMVVLDANGDELPDVYLGQGGGASDVIFLRDARVGWRVVSLDAAQTEPACAALAADINRDFRPDLVVSRLRGTVVYLNAGNGGFAPAAPIANDSQGGTAMVLSAGDVDGDGWIDVLEAGGAGTSADGAGFSALRVWRNEGGQPPRFSRWTPGPPLDACCDVRGGIIADLDNDGWQDIAAVTGDRGLLLWQNDGGRGLVPVTQSWRSGPRWSSIDGGDFDNDGDVDLVVGGDEEGRVMVLRNDGKLVFAPLEAGGPRSAGGKAGQTIWADMDGDGLLDIVRSAADWSWQRRPGQFDAVRFKYPPQPPGNSARVQVADLDRDGTSDALVVEPDGRVRTFANTHPRQWLAVRLRGRQDRSTLGARVTVRAKDGTKIVRHRVYNAQVADNRHDELLFGLGRQTQISLVEVDWPSGAYVSEPQPRLRRRIGFIEPEKSDTSRAGSPIIVGTRPLTSPQLECR